MDWCRPTGEALDKVVEQLKALKLTIRNTPEDSSPAGATCFFTGELLRSSACCSPGPTERLVAQDRPGKAKAPRSHDGGMPDRAAILKFITESYEPAGKREIAKHFKLRGAEKIALKALLKDMADEGLIDSAPGRAFHKMGGLPKVTVLKIIEVDGRELIGVPDNWQAEGMPAPKVRISERGRSGALAVGDRVLARTEEAGGGYRAFVMKKLQRAGEQLLGVVERDEGNGKLWLKPVDKRIRRLVPISDPRQGRGRPAGAGRAERPA